MDIAQGFLRLNNNDPVAVALQPAAAGAAVTSSIRLNGDVPAGHKIALRRIPKGEAVHKFGQVIGEATTDIAPGDHIHTHNLAFVPSAADHAIGSGRRNLPPVENPDAVTFEGIRRANGKVATRNYIGVLTTVNCSATVAKLIAERARSSGLLADYPYVDGVVALTHTLGCSAGEDGEAIAILRRTIAGYARHPNFAGVIVVGLGCETNQIDRLLADEALLPGANLSTFTIQETGGTAASLHEGLRRIESMLPEANAARRAPLPVRHLTVGLQCGGSDGFSALTANPALGVASDLLVRHGGTTILSETPEIYGAENVLLSRAVSGEVGRKLLERLSWWERHTKLHGESLDSNPSPGNKAGGLTTILEKSLGAAAKGGTADMVEVYRYAEPVTARGFVFMDTPGYDPVSATGQVAGGANLVAFTTGRGSCFGAKPAPSIKLATNSTLYRRMPDDIDINCGEIADGTASLEEMGERIFRRMIEVASGQKSKSEELGYGDEEFIPWHFGATL